jgi:Spy/CpxP family protein refolding chaperone
MKPRAFFISLVLLIAIQSATAQQPQPPAPPQDPFGDSLFPPELVMQHQEEIGLTEEQKSFLKTESRKAALRFTELQWQLSDAAEKMAAVVKQPKVDEQQAIAMLDQVLDAEREIKRLQVSLVIRIKNNLTPEQQARLQDIKNKARGK